eukprot:scaffold5725_cov210-Isochrysis_galbana.AAC.2
MVACSRETDPCVSRMSATPSCRPTVYSRLLALRLSVSINSPFLYTSRYIASRGGGAPTPRRGRGRAGGEGRLAFLFSFFSLELLK